jgi:hypothetical protein
MSEEIKHAKPIATLPPRALLAGDLNAAKLQLKRLRSEDSKKPVIARIKHLTEQLIAMGGAVYLE